MQVNATLQRFFLNITVQSIGKSSPGLPELGKVKSFESRCRRPADGGNVPVVDCLHIDPESRNIRGTFVPHRYFITI